MKKFFLILSILLVLAACAPTPTQTSEVWQTSEVLPTITPTPTKTKTPRPTATATPIALGVEQLDSMTNEQKLSIAPQPITAPDNIVSSFLPNQTAKDITWGAKSLTFWDRVVAYQGTTKTGESIALYYDLESGQWAKKYADFAQVSQIPVDQVPDVMFVGDRLIRNKPEYNNEWINQPKSMTEDGKMIFRDEIRDPIIVWDTVNKAWMTPEAANVVWNTEVWKQKLSEPAIDIKGKNFVPLDFLIKYGGKFLNNPEEIDALRDGSPFLILQSSGIITVGGDRQYVKERMKAGATIMTNVDTDIMSPLDFLWMAVRSTVGMYGNGNREVRVEVGQVRPKLRVNAQSSIETKNVVTITLADGTVVTPIFSMPEGNFKISKNGNTLDVISISEAGFIINETNWFNEIVKNGYILLVYYPQ